MGMFEIYEEEPMPSNFDGVPLHPLVVHAVVVLVPLAAVMVLLAAVSRRFRRWSAFATPLVATAALVSVPLATSSGESLEERVSETALLERHTEMGEQLTPWVIGLAVVAWVLWWLGRRAVAGTANGRHQRGGLLTGLVALVALVAVAGSSIQVYRIGHSGARSVWNDSNQARQNSGE
jgi:hypothetical protein